MTAGMYVVPETMRVTEEHTMGVTEEACVRTEGKRGVPSVAAVGHQRQGSVANAETRRGHLIPSRRDAAQAPWFRPP